MKFSIYFNNVNFSFLPYTLLAARTQHTTEELLSISLTANLAKYTFHFAGPNGNFIHFLGGWQAQEKNLALIFVLFFALLGDTNSSVHIPRWTFTTTTRWHDKQFSFKIFSNKIRSNMESHKEIRFENPLSTFWQKKNNCGRPWLFLVFCGKYVLN